MGALNFQKKGLLSDEPVPEPDFFLFDIFGVTDRATGQRLSFSDRMKRAWHMGAWMVQRAENGVRKLIDSLEAPHPEEREQIPRLMDSEYITTGTSASGEGQSSAEDLADEIRDRFDDPVEDIGPSADPGARPGGTRGAQEHDPRVERMNPPGTGISPYDDGLRAWITPRPRETALETPVVDPSRRLTRRDDDARGLDGPDPDPSGARLLPPPPGGSPSAIARRMRSVARESPDVQTRQAPAPRDSARPVVPAAQQTQEALRLPYEPGKPLVAQARTQGQAARSEGQVRAAIEKGRARAARMSAASRPRADRAR